MQGDRRNNREISTFSDPFGFVTGGSLFSNFFDRDPFNDPFFTRPFGSSFGSIFDSDSIFSDPFGERSAFKQNNFRPQQSSGRGPVIEELPDDHEDASGNKQQSSKDPIIEDPDDDDNQEQRTQMQSRWNGYQENSNTYGRRAPPQSFTFQSSSVSYGGPNGMYYTTSTTRRAGSDGVIEEEHKEADSTSGKASHRLSRGIQDKGHSLTRKLNTDGKIDTMETLHNLNEDEIAQFNEDWERKAEKSLPGWKKSHAGMLDGGRKTTSATRPTLPSNEPSISKEKEYNAAKGKKTEGLSQKSRRWFGQRKD